MINDRGMMARNTIIKLQDGKSYRMDFDMGALANAEGIYESKFGKIVGVDAIIGELVSGMARATMAFAYAALISAGEKLTWEEFGKNIYTFENYNVLMDAVTEGLAAMMRSDGDAEDDSKNGDSRGEI